MIHSKSLSIVITPLYTNNLNCIRITEQTHSHQWILYKGLLILDLQEPYSPWKLVLQTSVSQTGRVSFIIFDLAANKAQDHSSGGSIHSSSSSKFSHISKAVWIAPFDWQVSRRSCTLVHEVIRLEHQKAYMLIFTRIFAPHDRQQIACFENPKTYASPDW